MAVEAAEVDTSKEMFDLADVGPMQWAIHRAAELCGPFSLEFVSSREAVEEVLGWILDCVERLPDDEVWRPQLNDLIARMPFMSPAEPRAVVSASLVGDTGLGVRPITEVTGGMVSALFERSGAWLTVSLNTSEQQVAESALQATAEDTPPNGYPVVADVPSYPRPGVTMSRGRLRAFQQHAQETAAAEERQRERAYALTHWANSDPI